jgi:hypothetical protein
MWTIVAYRTKGWHNGANFLENAPGFVAASVVNHYNFMGNAVQTKLEIQMFHCGSDATGLVASGNYDGK